MEDPGVVTTMVIISLNLVNNGKRPIMEHDTSCARVEMKRLGRCFFLNPGLALSPS
jgi:hypothetical protein